MRSQKNQVQRSHTRRHMPAETPGFYMPAMPPAGLLTWVTKRWKRWFAQ